MVIISLFPSNVNKYYAARQKGARLFSRETGEEGAGHYYGGGQTPRSFMRPSGSSGIAPEYGSEMSHTSRPVQSLRALVS